MTALLFFTPCTPLLVCSRSPLHASVATPLCTLPPPQPSPTPSKLYRVLPAEKSNVEQLPPPPRHRSIPAIGYILEAALGLGDASSWAECYGSIYISNFMLVSQTLVTSHEAVEQVLRDEKVFFSSKAWFNIQEMFGEDMMLITNGAQHGHNSSELLPSFLDDVMTCYG